MVEALLYATTALSGFLVSGAGLKLLKARDFMPPIKQSEVGNDTDLPSVTVCIPARNERHALAFCLEAVLASSYEKLEIIVLDDSSGDGTSALIKSYAHAGVRFIKGEPLPEGWLGKNHALQGLLSQASGSYVLFIDVDTRLAPTAIEQLVRALLSRRSAMISVIPRREDGWRSSTVFAPLRYFWEIVFDRVGSPGTSSSAWMIKRSLLDSELGGFARMKKDIQPEATLADLLSAEGRYQLYISTQAFGVAYEKKWRSQLMTSSRMLYPLLNHQVFKSLVAVLVLLVILAPFAVMVSLFITGTGGLLLAASALVSLLIIATYAHYTHLVQRGSWWLSALLVPLIILQEIVLIIASLVLYKTGKVSWKGRPIQPEA